MTELLFRHEYAVSPPHVVTFNVRVFGSSMLHDPADELLTHLWLPDTVTVVVLHHCALLMPNVPSGNACRKRVVIKSASCSAQALTGHADQKQQQVRCCISR